MEEPTSLPRELHGAWGEIEKLREAWKLIRSCSKVDVSQIRDSQHLEDVKKAIRILDGT